MRHLASRTGLTRRGLGVAALALVLSPVGAFAHSGSGVGQPRLVE